MMSYRVENEIIYSRTFGLIQTKYKDKLLVEKVMKYYV